MSYKILSRTDDPFVPALSQGVNNSHASAAWPPAAPPAGLIKDEEEEEEGCARTEASRARL